MPSQTLWTLCATTTIHLMEREKKNAMHGKQKKTGFDSASLLFTGLAVILISIGIYMNMQDKAAVGVSQPNRYGQGGGTVLNIPGLFVVALGILFAAFPLTDIIRYFRNRH
jgi:hypothetical protein